MQKLIGLALLFTALTVSAQKPKTPEVKAPAKEEVSLGGIRFRNIGPAVTSGRIADFAVNPDNFNEYYVATASGGVWKTKNDGITYEPILTDKPPTLSVVSPLIRTTPTWCGWDPAKITTNAALLMVTVYTRAKMVVHPGKIWD